MGNSGSKVGSGSFSDHSHRNVKPATITRSSSSNNSAPKQETSRRGGFHVSVPKEGNYTIRYSAERVVRERQVLAENRGTRGVYSDNKE